MSSIPRPEGHHSITAGCIVHKSAEVLKFLQDAFDGAVVDRYDMPDGSIMHAEVMVGDSVVMLGEPMGGMEPMPGCLTYYVDNGDLVDVVYQKALECGATSESEPKNQFYGYRSAVVRDVGGNRWTISAVVEALTREEMHRRSEAMFQS